ncbi:MAG: UvrD-helicase domain-containing protein [Candidatus Scalindua sp.]|nr:UvrD-helicase domain-containing protein [Candidatus Scalindua sp.]
MDNKLTPAQEKGVKITDRDLCMVAGPGSGKTSVLVERFSNLITTRKATMNEILTLTFTEKAANEMKMRVASLFEQKGMEKERQEIEFAFLSTIHSFCARFLREHAIEAGIDPQFRVMEELEADRLKEQTLEDTLEKWAENKILDVFFDDLFWTQTDAKKSGTKSFKENLLHLYEKIRNACVPISETVNPPDLYSSHNGFRIKSEIKLSEYSPRRLLSGESPRRLLSGDNCNQDLVSSKTENQIGFSISQEIVLSSNSIKDLISEIRSIYSEKKPPVKTREKIKRILECWNDSNLQNNIAELYGINEHHQTLSSPSQGGERGEVKTTENSTADNLTFVVLNKVKAILSSINLSVSNEVKQPLKSLREECNDLIGLLAEVSSTRIKIAVRDFLVAFDAAYRERKRSESFVDFTDLEDKTIELLKSNEFIKNEIRERFKFILVDEFQDTSRLQKTIIDLIRGKDNLFVVGDEKQSIYGFRNADVEIFQDMQKEVEPGSLIRLSENFRSRPQILDFINHIFSKLWSENSTGLQGGHINSNPDHSPPCKGGDKKVDSSLSASNTHELKAGAEFSEKSFPSIEIIVAEGENKTHSRKRESMELAGRIREIVDNGEIRITNKKERERNITYRDFAILFRSTTDIKLYENALSQLEIPYYVVSGRGFFNTTEITDLINLLAVIESPLDEINLAAVLKSPFVGIDDDALFWLSDHAHKRHKVHKNYQSAHKSNNKKLLYQVLDEVNAIPEIKTDSKEKIMQFTQFLNELQHIKSRTSLWHLISCILKQTEFQSKMLLFSNGKRRYANLLKLVELCKNQEEFAPLTLRDFIEIAEGYKYKEIRESEAHVESEEDNVVKLVTVHSAKGLEFPVVVVADIDRDNTRPSDYFVYSKNHGMSFKILNPLTNEEEKPRSYEQINSEMKEKELQESQRLLFVALTRAQEHLILSGGIAKGRSSGDKDNGNWYNYVSSALDLNQDFKKSPSILRPDNTIAVSNSPQTPEIRVTRVNGKNNSPDREVAKESWVVRKKKPVTQYKTEIAASGMIDALPPSREIGEIGKNILAETGYIPEVDNSHYVYTVTEILKFHFCPQLYYFHSVLGLQGIGKRNWTEPKNEGDEDKLYDDELPGHELGNIVHHVFKRYHFPESAHMLKKYIEKKLLDTGTYPDKKSIDMVTKWILSFYNSTIGKEVVSSKRQYREASFIFHHKHNLIRGQIDLFYFTNENRVKIVDYKANEITIEEIQEKAKLYKIQMQLYARALEAIYEEKADEAILYFLVSDKYIIVDTTENGCRELDTTLDDFFASHKKGVFKRERGFKCRWCEFEMICKTS